MKTIADLKKLLVVGARVRVTYLRPPIMAVTIPPSEERVITRVMSKKFTTRRSDGKEPECQIPSKAAFRPDGPRKVTFLDSDMGGAGVPYISFEFLE